MYKHDASAYPCFLLIPLSVSPWDNISRDIWQQASVYDADQTLAASRYSALNCFKLIKNYVSSSWDVLKFNKIDISHFHLSIKRWSNQNKHVFFNFAKDPNPFN